MKNQPVVVEKKQNYICFGQNAFSPMEIIVSTHAINTALIQRVTESKAVVLKSSDVIKVHCILFCIPKMKKKTEPNNYDCCILHLQDAFIIKINIEIVFFYFLDMESYAISVSPSDNLPITVQSLTCACILLIIGVLLTICVIR